MSKEDVHRECQYEWSFESRDKNYVSNDRGKAATTERDGICLPSIVPNASANSSRPHHQQQQHQKQQPHHQTSRQQHANIPYSGPTLWNPRIQGRSPDKFLTLTPLRSDHKAAVSTLPVISITPRSGSREFSFLTGPNTQGRESLPRPSGRPEVPQISTGHNAATSQGLPAIQKQRKNSDRVSIFPDVYAVVKSPRQRDNTYRNDPLHKSRRKQHNANDLSFSKQLMDYQRLQLSEQDNTNTEGMGTGMEKLENASNFAFADKNIQDPGTLFSRRQDAFYHRLAREPSTLIPPPVGFRYVFPKDNTINSKLENDVDEIARYKRSRLKDRRSYIRWNVHMKKSRKTSEFHNSTHDYPNTELIQPENERLLANSKMIKSVPRENPNRQPRRDSGSASGSAIAAQFCDVLGQKTCQRCREFYAKNYGCPHSPQCKSTTRNRPSSPVAVTRENTGWGAPTVGLQKVVIRIKDQHGRMAVAAEEVNKQLL